MSVELRKRVTRLINTELSNHYLQRSVNIQNSVFADESDVVLRFCFIVLQSASGYDAVATSLSPYLVV